MVVEGREVVVDTRSSRAGETLDEFVLVIWFGRNERPVSVTEEVGASYM